MNNTVKTVQVYQAGKQLKQFNCTRCEIGKQMLLFHGVPRKKDNKPVTVRYYGELFYDIDHLARVTNIFLPNEPDISILVTW